MTAQIPQATPRVPGLLSVLGVLGVLASPLFGACQPSDPCDPGYREETSWCVPIEAEPDQAEGAADAGADGDAAAGPADSADDPGAPNIVSCEPGEGQAATFGEPCTTDADCACPAPTCLPAPLGYCSQVQCDPDDSAACPDGFTCFEVPETLQQGGVTHLCLLMGG